MKILVLLIFLVFGVFSFGGPSVPGRLDVKIPSKLKSERQTSSGKYPGSTEEERTLIEAAITYPSKRHLQPARIVKGTFEPRVCQQTRAQAEFLAAKNFPGALPTSMGHLGYEKRAKRLIGGDGAEGELPAGQYEEIVTETFPGLTRDEAARTCLQNWYDSPKHVLTLTKPSAFYCLSMVKGRSGRYYCVGIALYSKI